MTAPAAVLFAADWFEVVVPIVVFVIWIINQISGVKKAAGRPPARPNAPPAGNAPAAGQRGLMDEVERFLREARQAMEQQKPGARPQQPQPAAKPGAKAKPNVRSPKTPRRKEEKPAPRRSLAEQTKLQPQAAERELDEIRLGGSVAQHVREHLDTSRFDERAGKLSHLTQTVEQDIGSHVRGVFDHSVGSLSQQNAAAESTVDAQSSAAQIVAMLRDPAGMRNAIILQEILSPPTHRW